jgi:hypothetical protein
MATDGHCSGASRRARARADRSCRSLPLTKLVGAPTIAIMSRGMHRRSHLFVALALPLLAGAAVAAEAPSPVLSISDAELTARLGFLEQRLEAGRPTALAWQWGWTGFYTASFALSVGYAIAAEDGDDRVRVFVDAAKSGLATVQTLRLLRDPLPANLGAQPMREVPGNDQPARLERLAVGERQLLASVARAETRYSLRRHLIVLGGNLLGGAAILALGDARDALQSTAIGTAVGEAQIWSEPWRATSDLRDYEAAFAATPGTGWDLRPKGTGVELVLRF